MSQVYPPAAQAAREHPVPSWGKAGLSWAQTQHPTEHDLTEPSMRVMHRKTSFWGGKASAEPKETLRAQQSSKRAAGAGQGLLRAPGLGFDPYQHQRCQDPARQRRGRPRKEEALPFLFAEVPRDVFLFLFLLLLEQLLPGLCGWQKQKQPQPSCPRR